MLGLHLVEGGIDLRTSKKSKDERKTLEAKVLHLVLLSPGQQARPERDKACNHLKPYMSPTPGFRMHSALFGSNTGHSFAGSAQ